MAERTGQAFRFDGALPEGFVYDTEPASRALVALRSLAADRVWPLVQAIQQAFYVEGRDVTRPAVLVELAEQLGVPRQAFAAAFDSAAQRAATQADFAWAQNLGIAGFPTLLAERNGQLALLTNGYQPLETLAPLLGRWLERRAYA
ncbi:DSBA-like thioredoxin domain protein [compost metagenome]